MADESLKAEVEAAIDAAYQELGPDRVERAAVVNAFLGRGVSRATLFRWVNARIETGKPAAKLVKRIAAEGKKARRASPKAGEGFVAAAVEVATRDVQAVPTLVSLPAPGGSTLDMVAKLRDCIEIAEQVIRHARTREGDVRMSRTLLAASDHLGRSVERLVKLHEAIHSATAIERFQRETVLLLERVISAHPQAGLMIADGLRRIAADFRV